VKKKEGKFYTKKQMLDSIEFLEKGPHKKAYVALLLCCCVGLRISELEQITKASFKIHETYHYLQFQ
jgi:integrase